MCGKGQPLRWGMGSLSVLFLASALCKLCYGFQETARVYRFGYMGIASDFAGFLFVFFHGV